MDDSDDSLDSGDGSSSSESSSGSASGADSGEAAGNHISKWLMAGQAIGAANAFGRMDLSEDEKSMSI